MFSSESGRPSRSSITCVGSRERVAAVERIKDDVDAPLHHRPQTFDRARRHGLEKQRLEAIMIVVVAVEEPAVIVLDDVAEPRGAGSRQVRIERLDPVDAQVWPGRSPKRGAP